MQGAQTTERCWRDTHITNNPPIVLDPQKQLLILPSSTVSSILPFILLWSARFPPFPIRSDHFNAESFCDAPIEPITVVSLIPNDYSRHLID